MAVAGVAIKVGIIVGRWGLRSFQSAFITQQRKLGIEAPTTKREEDDPSLSARESLLENTLLTLRSLLSNEILLYRQDTERVAFLERNIAFIDDRLAWSRQLGIRHATG